MGAQLDEVYINKGKAHGMWIGDKIAIRKNPETNFRTGEKDRHIVGFAKVVQASDDTATAVITASSGEVFNGDIIEPIKE
ncbi:MAG: hypothetical protein HY756_01970 [Nitrospirae bacterium]|nr:hypothetical protein [Nitrospirota bacterium]